MNSTLKEIKDISSENCVTIALNTHRAKPDYQKDPLTLKNLIKEAERRLSADSDKRVVQKLVQQLAEVESKIDHDHNLESLILFVNEDIAKYVRLPVAVVERVVIDETFATRDLVRALHLESAYYVLVLSQQKVRLIEAFNEKVVAELGGAFPIENNQFYSTNKAALSNANRQTNLIAEFFNSVDKEVNNARKRNPLPVLICTEEGNYHEYLKIADQRQSLFDTFLNKNRMGEKAQAIVEDAWKIVRARNIQRNNARKEELQKAVNTGLFLSDVNDIWKAIPEGRIQTLFVEQGLFQPAVIEGGAGTFSFSRGQEPERSY